ncbi:MAG: prepilin-type N-terminal cleavage/methylation domain-containing protein, partial [Bacilli bacterium]
FNMKKKNGFTLVELLAVIVVLSIIMVIAVISVNKVIETSRKNAFVTNAKIIEKAVKKDNVFQEEEKSYNQDSDLEIDDKGLEYSVVMVGSEVRFNSLSNDKLMIDVTKCKSKTYCLTKEVTAKIVIKKGEVIDKDVIIYPVVKDNVPGDITNGEKDGSVLTGTKELPYEIRSIEDLVALSSTVNDTSNNYSGKYIKLAYNLDFKSNNSYAKKETVKALKESLTTGEGFMPIGGMGKSFSGTFDGDNKYLNNLYINRLNRNRVALIGNNTGTIKDINITNEKVKSSGFYAGGLVGYNEGTIQDINITNGKVESSGDSAGGVAGQNAGGPIKAVIIENTIVKGKDNVGGLVGLHNNGGLLSSSKFNGDVTGNNAVGLAVGNLDDTANSLIVSGNVTGVNYVGGLVGANNDNNITGIFTEGSVTGISGVYRIAGYIAYGRGTEGCANTNITVNGVKVTSTTINSNNGKDVPKEILNSINSYELVVDTYIGGDNDGDGYYFDYDKKGNLVVTKATDEINDLTKEGEVYLIKSYEDLKKASQHPSYKYKLVNDINATGKNFYMLGSEKNKFTGVFDGNNKTLNNIKLETVMGGVFGYNTGTISNLTVNNANIKGMENLGLIGYNTGTIKDVNITNEKVESSGTYTGGIVGQNYGGTIKAVTVENTIVKGKDNTGGLVGYHIGGLLSSSKFNGDVTGINKVGLAVGNSNSTSNSLIVSGNVTGVDFVGGLNGSGGSISGIFTEGSVTGTSNVNRLFVYYAGEGYANANIMVNGVKVTSTATYSNHGKDVPKEILNSINSYELV